MDLMFIRDSSECSALRTNYSRQTKFSGVRSGGETMLTFWSMRQVHDHSKALNAQPVGKGRAFGGGPVKTTHGTRGRTGAHHRAAKRRAVFSFNQQMLRTETTSMTDRECSSTNLSD